MITKVITASITSSITKAVTKIIGLSAASILLSTASASAVETITLRYYGSDPNVPSETTITLDEIKQFVNSGAGALPQQAREFLDLNRQDPTLIQRALATPIQLPGTLETVEAEFLDSSIGRFVVAQLQRLIQGSSELTDLRTAVRTSIQDRQISVLEVLENYPVPEVTLNITGLVTTYNDVSAFVERILPALEVAKDYLQRIVCDCEAPTTASTSASTSTAASTSVSTPDSPQTQLTSNTAVNCLDQHTATQTP
ncbi:alpha/beta hydrolase [Leptolyngbya sp. NK1-12]|uniref:Alpha/beta hydrolase n=1 Tax=Leptolyngbya sp. NK1-12 TaxID=2547451 RepID=A0AA96WM53_9CYAN|nr:alpha/beta hydrolase [Leptolyngbya sp. NK1-12]WNZ27610.1 alpha/beta hydrolase [Leptolyngbya sp. NK1-12]